MSISGTHALYRFYDATGILLYVGITADPGARWRKHAGDKPWWHEVRGITVETYPDRESVLAAEKRAIQVENPRYNIVRPKARHPRPAERPVRLVWICQECSQPVDDGLGYIHVDEGLVYEREQFFRTCEASKPDTGLVDLSEIRSWPRTVPWEVHHGACDPSPDHNCYWFDVARARTHAHLLDWSAHLLEKDWLQQTDWAELIRRMAAVDA